MYPARLAPWQAPGVLPLFSDYNYYHPYYHPLTVYDGGLVLAAGVLLSAV